MATKWMDPARDALDTLILSAANLTELENFIQVDFIPFDPILKRTESTIQHNGHTFKVTKGLLF